ncbi:hypothetical protein [Salibacterium sp. K-3]
MTRREKKTFSSQISFSNTEPGERWHLSGLHTTGGRSGRFPEILQYGGAIFSDIQSDSKAVPPFLLDIRYSLAESPMKKKVGSI